MTEKKLCFGQDDNDIKAGLVWFGFMFHDKSSAIIFFTVQNIEDRRQFSTAFLCNMDNEVFSYLILIYQFPK